MLHRQTSTGKPRTMFGYNSASEPMLIYISYRLSIVQIAGSAIIWTMCKHKQSSHSHNTGKEVLQWIRYKYV